MFEEIEIELDEIDGEEIELDSFELEVEKIYPELKNLNVIPKGEQQVFNHEDSYGYDTVTVGGVKLQSKEITPTTEKQRIIADEEYSGLNEVNVEAVMLQRKEVQPKTSAQDITPDDGYMGLSGLMVGAVTLQSKEVKPATETQKIIPDDGYMGLNEVTVGAVLLEEKNVKPTIESQTITPSADYMGISKIVVDGANLQSKTVTPTKDNQTINADSEYVGLEQVNVEPIPSNYIEPTGTLDITQNGEYDVTNYKKAGVNIGTEIEDGLVDGTLTEYTNDRVTTVAIRFPVGVTKKVSFPNVESVSAVGVLSDATALEEVYFPKLKRISAATFMTNTKVSHLNFPSLEYLYGSMCLSNNSRLTEIVFPKLNELNGSNVFMYCSNLKKAIFLKSDDICKMTGTSIFYNSGIAADGGKILVPNHLIETYKSATNWSVYADRIVGINLESIEIKAKDEINTHLSNTLQLKVTYNGGSDSLFIEEQNGYTFNIEGNATVDENNLLTLTENATVGDVIKVTVVSTYDNTITDTKEIIVVYKDKFVEVDLNDGQWVDSGTTVDDNIVYMSDKGSFNINNGKSVARINILGYKQVTVYIRSYAEHGYDYTEAFSVDRTASRNAGSFNTRQNQSETKYAGCIYNLDGGEHFIEILYSKDGGGNQNDDRGYFYIGECI